MQTFSRHRLVVALSAAALAFVLGGFAWAYFALRGIAGTFLILHYNDTNGITSIGGLENVAFMGVFGVLVVAMNFFIALAFDARDRFLGKFIAALTFVFAVLLFVAFAAIINVNV